MKGQETFKFAVNAMCKDLTDVIEEAGISPEEVDHVIPHQANIRIIDGAKKRLNIPPERFHSNIDKYGNTSAASIPILIDELNREGRIKKNDILALAAFGGHGHAAVGGACTGTNLDGRTGNLSITKLHIFPGQYIQVVLVHIAFLEIVIDFIPVTFF